MIEVNKYDNHITLKCSVSVFNHGSLHGRLVVHIVLGGRAYWAGRAAARQLFGSCGRPYLWPAHFFCDVNFFFLYIAIMTGENLQ